MDTVKLSSPMPDANQCPHCGTPLPTGALAGLCPACLLKLGAAADTVTDANQKKFVPPSVAELAPLFPQLEILELIGKGGMGAVYKARQKQLDRIVALKILPPGIGNDAAFAERFTREAKALAKLNHPGIVTLYEFGVTSGYQPATLNSQLFFFLMEFVDGVNLRQLLHAGRISAREALAIVPQICDALQFAHDQGIVHRDIKPENILLDRRGRVKVADFGLVKIMGGNDDEPAAAGHAVAGSITLTDAGKVMGTPQYMSPEQIHAPGEVDHRADIYALGVVFYQMLTGELPGKKIEAPSKKVQIDVRLDEIVLRALEKKPELRFQQASILKTQIETISESENPPDEPESSPFFPALAWGLVYAGFVAWMLMGLELPPRVASHFNVAGKADGWMSRDAYYLFAGGLPLFFAGFFWLVSRSAIHFPQLVNLPHRDFWLAPERRAFTAELLLSRLLWLATLMTIFFGGLHWLVAQANRHPQPHLDMGGLVVLLTGFFIGLLMWLVALVTRFAEVGNAPGAATRKPKLSRSAMVCLICIVVAEVALISSLLVHERTKAAVPEIAQLMDGATAEQVAHSPLIQSWSTQIHLFRYVLVPLAVAGIFGAIIFGKLAAAQKKGRPKSDPKFLPAIEVWLALMDNGDFAKSWETAAPYFQRAMAKTEWVDRLKEVRHPLGPVLARKLISGKSTTGGMWFEAKYETSFAGLLAATETVTFAKQANGDWLAIGYLIRPAGEMDTATFFSDGRQAMFFSSLSGVLGIVAFCYWPQPPNVLITWIPITGILGIVYAVRARELSSGKQALAIGCVNLGIWLIVLMVCLGTTGKHPAATGQSGLAVARKITGPPFLAQIQNGEVELLVIGDQPWTNTFCWRPDGTISSQPFPIDNGSMESWVADKVTKKIAFRIHNESTNGISCPVCRADTDSGVLPEGLSWQRAYARQPDDRLIQLIACPTNAATANISLGMANGVWEAALTLEHQNDLGGARAEGDWSATWNAILKDAAVAVNCNYSKKEDWEARMVGVSDDGKITVIPENSSSVSTLSTGGILLVNTNEFAHLKEFQLQRRKYQWVEFRNVSLQPRHQTTVTVKDFGAGKQIAPVAAQNFSFGPVVERVLPCELPLNFLAGINFGSGQVETISFGTNDVSPGGQSGDDYFNQKGVDMTAIGDPKLMPQSSGLNCRLGTFALPVAAAEWDRASAAIVLMHATNLPTMQAPVKNTPEFMNMTVMLFSEDGVLPKTYIFHTAKGEAGILQITGFTENPRGVKLRYKLVQNIAAASASVEDDVARLKHEIEMNELAIARKKFKAEVLAQGGKEFSASNIVAMVKHAYATIYSYRDSGWTVHEGGFSSTNQFTQLLDRRKLYRIRVVTGANPFSHTNRWWSDGTTEFWQQDVSGIAENSSPGTESCNISLVSQDSFVPALFFNLGWGNILNNMAYASPVDLVRRRDETISGVNCYVLEQADNGWTVWVGKNDFLIRQYRSFISKASMVEARKHSPSPTQVSLPNYDITTVQSFENIVVNEDLPREKFISASTDGK